MSGALPRMVWGDGVQREGPWAGELRPAFKSWLCHVRASVPEPAALQSLQQPNTPSSKQVSGPESREPGWHSRPPEPRAPLSFLPAKGPITVLGKGPGPPTTGPCGTPSGREDVGGRGGRLRTALKKGWHAEARTVN